ncbi:ankyrin repeat domain-containing protein [Stenotrophomonas maltophilia]|nr:ankyrin repeat domain-containing protein [Stenotrophomonas maltophilia]
MAIYLEVMGGHCCQPILKGLDMNHQIEKSEEEWTLEENFRADLMDGWDPMELDGLGRNSLQQWLSTDFIDATPEEVVRACKVLMEHGINPDTNSGAKDTNSGAKYCFSWPTPLYMAVEQGNLGCVRLFLEYGADPNRYDASRTCEGTPLMKAALAGNEAMCLILLEYGADPLRSGFFEFYGPNPATEARESVGYTGDDVGYVGRLEAREATPLFCAAISGKTAVCNLLLEHGADATTSVEVNIVPVYHRGSEVDSGSEGYYGRWNETPAQAAERSRHSVAARAIRSFLRQKDLEKILPQGPLFSQQTRAAEGAKADGLRMVIGGQMWSPGQEMSNEAPVAAMEAPRQRLRL